MSIIQKRILALLLVGVLAWPVSTFSQQEQSDEKPQKQVKDKSAKKTKEQKEQKREATAEAAANLPAVMWRDPGDISKLDLVHGEGGEADAPDPQALYTFEKEDLNGSSTKFYVKDSNGVEWLVKLGVEARPEVAASRFVWAMGYIVDEDYYLPEIHVKGLPVLRRDMHAAEPATGYVPKVRMKRQIEGVKKAGNWDWFDNPLKGTREFDGLRVIMALINNWDLKTVNNKIYVANGEREFVVSDLGGSLGRTNMPFVTKGNERDFSHAKFIRKRNGGTVTLVMNTNSLFLFWPFDWKDIHMYARMRHIEENIPVANAKWVGQNLAQLTPQQIQDAFRAAGFSGHQVEGYTRTIQKRIAELNSL